MRREQIAAIASAVVMDAYREMRRLAGQDAATWMMHDMIKSAAFVSGGPDDIGAITVLEFLADQIEDEMAGLTAQEVKSQ